MTTRGEEIRSDLAVPPGEYLAEALDELGMSQADLARRMGRPPQAINEIVKGAKALTPETALQLEQVLGVPAHIWLGLESEYRLVLAEQLETEQVKKETTLLAAFPYKELVALGCITQVRKAEDKVRELRRFFRVASLEQLGRVPAYAPAFRVVGGNLRQPSPYGLAAWLHCGVKEAEEAEVAPFSEASLRAALPALRALTSVPAEDVVDELRTRLAECGLVFALFPHFPKTYAQGATFWLEPRKKAVLLMSIRGRWSDIFWFSFFHELAHILLHRGMIFIEMEGVSSGHAPEEEAADRFASDLLLPPCAYSAFLSARDFSEKATKRFASVQEIHPGIVVGRLQHDGLIGPDRLNYLRDRYRFAVPVTAS